MQTILLSLLSFFLFLRREPLLKSSIKLKTSIVLFPYSQPISCRGALIFRAKHNTHITEIRFEWRAEACSGYESVGRRAL